MNKMFMYALGIAILFNSCSPSDEGNSSVDPEPTVPNVESKYISKMTGGDDTEFVYDNGLLIKGMDKTSGIFFQVDYNSKSKPEKVYTCECGWPENGMEYNIPVDYPESYQVWNYIYEGEKLSKITSVSGKILIDLTYDEEGRVKEFYEAERYSDDYDDYENTQYIYDGEGAIESYTFYDSYNDTTRSGAIQLDEKVNPLYIIWQQFGLIIPADISEISTYNIPFFPNNVTTIYDGNTIMSKANMTYEDNYPVFYEEAFSKGDGVIIEYLQN